MSIVAAQHVQPGSADPNAPTRTAAPRPSDDDTRSADADPTGSDAATPAGGASYAATPAGAQLGDTPPDASPGAAAGTTPVGAAPRPRLPAPLQYRDPDRYEVIAEHGRGGLGRVMRARDRELGRSVAIKELLEPTQTSELRFFREAMITARLEHPGIVPVHEAGRWPDGTPFYAMKLVAGRSLRALIDAAATLEHRLALLPHVIAVADAIAYAHSRKIIHRDLKPSNVIIGEFGETAVIDWGLARTVADSARETTLFETEAEPHNRSADLTQAGSVMGTPAYMAPEQAKGDEVDERADVYALGAVLYHLLAQRAPYVGDTQEQIVAQVLSGPPTPIHRAGRIPVELAAILEKAMARERALRYADASEFSTDLRRFSTGHLVSAHSYSRGDLLRRWISKRRSILSVAAVAVLTLVIGAAWSVRRIVRERDQASRSEHLATARANDIVLEQAEALLLSDPTRALALAASPQPDVDHQARADLVAARAFSKGVSTATLRTEHAVIHGIFWIGSDDLLFYGNQDSLSTYNLSHRRTQIDTRLSRFGEVAINRPRLHLAYVDAQRILQLRDLRTNRTRTLGDGVGTVLDIEISADGGVVVASFSDGDIHVWRDDNAEWIVRRGAGILQTLQLSPSGHLLAACGHDGKLAVWQVDDRRNVYTGHCDGLKQVPFVFDASSSALAVGFRNGNLVQLRFDGQHGATLALDASPRFVRASPNSRRYIIATQSGEVLQIDQDTFHIYWRLHTGCSISALQISPAGDTIVAGHEDGTITALDTRGERLASFRGHASAIDAMDVSPDGKLLATTASAEVRIWALSRKIPTAIVLSAVGLLDAKFSPDGRWFATISRDGSVAVCDQNSLKCVSVQAHTSYATGLAWLPDSSQVISGGWDGQIHQFSPETHTEHRLALPGPAEPVSVEGVVRHSEHVLTYTRGSSIEIRTLRDGTSTGERLPTTIRNPTLSADGTTIAGIDAGTIAIYATEPRLHLVQNLSCDAAKTVAISKSGRFVLCATTTGAITVLDRSSSRVTDSWNRVESSVEPRRGEFSPDELSAIVSFADGSIVHLNRDTHRAFVHFLSSRAIMDIAASDRNVAALTVTGEVWLGTLPEPSSLCVADLRETTLRTLDISPDGKSLISASEHGRLHYLSVSQCAWSKNVARELTISTPRATTE